MNTTIQNEHQDIEQLRKSAQLVLDFHESLTDFKRDNFPMALFRALAELTLNLAEPDVSKKDIRFSAKELKEKINEFKKIKSTENEADWVRKRWNELKNELKERKEHLQGFAKDSGYEFYPWIDKNESPGGQGNSSDYYLIFQTFNDQEIRSVQYPCPEDGVRYVPESLPNIPSWARWIEGFVLKGWRKYAYIMPALFILLLMVAFGWLLLMLGLYTEISTVKWLTYWIVALGGSGLVLFSPLYRVASQRIVIASDWMAAFKEKSSVQLELKKIGIDEETGNPIRELRLVVYSAKCPICGGRVEVESGGLRFPFRLVGKCIESPREHIFSFDHVTRVGSRLIK